MNLFAKLLLLLFFTSCSGRPDFAAVKSQHQSSFLEVTDANDELIHETRRDFSVQRRSWLSLSDLPNRFIEELLLFEDQRFYSHIGVDPLALVQAIKSYPSRGASTITMQTWALIENKKYHKSVRSKLKQIFAALTLELSWKKNLILETYINALPFKGELQGLHAASMSIFSKHPRALNQEERVLLFSMIPSPNQTEEKLLKRACRYLNRLVLRPDCKALKNILDASYYSSPKTELQTDLIPHLAQQLKGNGQVKTTLLKSLQIEASQALNAQIDLLQNQNVTDGAVLVIDRSNHNILSYVGSSGSFSNSPHVDHVRALRQAGSTLKPLLYANAISKKLITMNSPLKDDPFTITKDGLTYGPENYQKSFTYEEVPAKFALASSLNIPAVRVIDLLTPERFYETLQELEMRDLFPMENYGHSMALGAVDVTLWDLVRAYGTMANAGNFRELNYLQESTNPIKNIATFTPEVSFIIGQILSEKENRHLSFGIQSSLATDTWSAVKTGTSKDMRDNWCIGYTDRYVIGVWIGNSSGEPMWNVSGISGAAPIFSQLVSYLHQTEPSWPPNKPESVVEIDHNYYIAGTEPKYNLPLVKDSSLSRIIFPQHGSQFAYDPEIPEVNQRIHFKQSSLRGRWKLNGKDLSAREIDEGFLPKEKGKFNIELWEEGTLKDSVTFHVRAGKAQR